MVIKEVNDFQTGLMELTQISFSARQAIACGLWNLNLEVDDILQFYRKQKGGGTPVCQGVPCA